MSVIHRIEGTKRFRQTAPVKTDTGHTILLTDKLPPIDERVMVVTDKFRCLGYRDQAGAWRHAQNGQGIDNVRGWYGLESRPESRPAA